MSFATGTAPEIKSEDTDRAIPFYLGISIACPMCGGRKNGCTACNGTGQSVPDHDHKKPKRVLRKPATIF